MMENVEYIYGLSPMQEGMLFHTLLTPDTRPYFEQGIFTIRGKIQERHFEAAWRKAVDQYACLRTSFYWKDLDRPVQVVHRQVTLPFEWHDWTGHSDSEKQTAFEEFLRADRAEGFQLSTAPLIRLNVLQFSEKEYRVLLSFHHLLLDAWSLQVMLRAVMFFYAAFCEGREATLERGRPYRDYIAWLQQQDLVDAEMFWRQQLKGFTAPSKLGSALAAATVAPDQEYVTYEASLSSELTAQLRAFAAKSGVTLNTVAQGAWAVLLARYTGQNDVLFGATVSGRPAELSGIENIVGLFINTLPLRLNAGADAVLGPWLKEVQGHQQEALKYQYSPLTQVQTWSEAPAGTPLFDHLLVFEGIPDVGVQSPAGQEPVEFSFELIERTGYPLTLTIQPGDQVLVKFTYSQLRFDQAAIERMFAHLEQILQQMARDPQQRLAQITLASVAGEREKLLVEWNRTTAEYPREKCLPELIEQQAARTPNAIAVEYESRQLTYADLNQRANQLAHYLTKLGVGPETLVGICVERGADMLVGLLAVLKAGGAYVPLDPRYPADRIQYTLEDSRAAVLLTEQSLLASLPAFAGEVVALDSQWNTIARESSQNLERAITPQNIAYVIYTSGSTGQPKGVQISHGAVVNFLTSMRKQPGMGPDDILLAVTTLSFDIAGLELYLPLVVGARVRILSRDAAVDGTRLLREVNRGVTVLQATPASWLLLLEAGWTGSRKLKALCGGEALTPDLAAKLATRCASVWNMYGPTETTIWSLVESIEQGQERVLIGRPIANTQAYALDEDMQPAPVGVAAELYLGGDGLARGYLRQSELTAERFVPNPFSPSGGERLYRTGDLARYTTEGKLECLGRIDHQVKIRGYRIELGEIESALLAHEQVKQAVVVAREDEPGQKRLVAYIVSRGDIAPSELRDGLKQRLPEYMLPAAFVPLEALPLTPNGKIDRRALPAPPPDSSRTENYIAPRTPMEEIVAGIWAEVLKLDRVGAEDNFFELGATSLLATRVMSRVRKSVGLDLPLKTLFELPTVAAFAENLDQAIKTGTQPDSLPLRRSDRAQDLPLSFAQQRLWFMDKLEPESAAYNMPFGVRLTGDLNKAAVRRTFEEIVRRHEVLRTRFPERDGVTIQEVLPELMFHVEEFDLRNLPEAQREAEATRIEREDANLSFDFRQAPLLRVKLVQLNDAEHVLLTNMHHIVSDGWSLELLMREFTALYEAYCAGQPSPLPELEIQYADYAVWQREWLQGAVLEEQIEYWRKELDGVAALELPTDRPRPAVPTRRGGDVSVQLGVELSEKVKRFSQEQGVTVFMTLLAGFQMLLARYSGQEDIVMGTDVANRNRLEIEPLVGFFVNQLVLRTHVKGEATVAELVQQVRKATLGAYAHQDLPFEKLVEELHPERNVSREPLFQVKVVMQNAVEAEATTGGLAVTRFGGGLDSVRQDLELDIAETPDGIQGFLHYAADLFDHWRMERLVEHYKGLLDSAVSNPQELVSQLAFMSEAEQRQMLVEWNQTAAEYERKSIHQLFEEQAAKTPGKTALVFEDRELTYSELNHRANQLAHHLRSLGAGPQTLVGICVERSLETVVGLLGVLKSGAAYVPLDPTYPAERLRSMIRDAEVEVLLTHSRLIEALPETGGQLICLDGDWNQIAQQPMDNPAINIDPDDLAYVIYTSGSTGKPKGVQIAHGNVANFFTGMDRSIQCGPADTLLAVTGISFDISVLELLWTLTRGAKVVLVADPFRTPARKPRQVSTKQLEYSLFYSNVDQQHIENQHSLFIEGIKYADQHDFAAVWTTERHMHAPCGPRRGWAAASAALASTGRIQIRAGCLELPPRDLIGVAEEWSAVDSLSGTRTGPAIASGWPVWVTAGGDADSFVSAGRSGLNVFTYLLGQTVDELAEKIQLYRDALAQAGHDPESGKVTLMLHTLLGDDEESVREQVRGPFTEYLESCEGLLDRLSTNGASAFEHYYGSALFGTAQSCAPLIERLKEIGVDEIACLIDFGVDSETALDGLAHIVALSKPAYPQATRKSLGELAAEHAATLMQSTPSMMRMVAAGTDGFAALRSLRALLLGGETLPPALAREIQAVLPCRLVNMYGPTETTVWSSTGDVEEPSNSVSVGRPIANTELYIFDNVHGQPVPVGVVGELFIGGDGVARGYLKRPELTAEKFVPDAFSGRQGSRLYSTGDLARYLPDGRVELVGRSDYQVKIRGFRIELGEIEAALGRYPGVQEAVVTARESSPGEKRLVAYVVTREELTADELKEALRRRLPEYMVPATFVMLDALPLTPNGKVDRKALPAPDASRAAHQANRIAPRTETERFVAEIWEQVLRAENVGVEDNFFDLGGHSLLLVQVHTKLAARFEIAMVDLFAYPNIAALAQYLDRSQDDAGLAVVVQQRASRQLEAINTLREATTRV